MLDTYNQPARPDSVSPRPRLTLSTEPSQAKTTIRLTFHNNDFHLQPYRWPLCWKVPMNVCGSEWMPSLLKRSSKTGLCLMSLHMTWVTQPARLPVTASGYFGCWFSTQPGEVFFALTFHTENQFTRWEILVPSSHWRTKLPGLDAWLVRYIHLLCVYFPTFQYDFFLVMTCFQYYCFIFPSQPCLINGKSTFIRVACISERM